MKRCLSGTGSDHNNLADSGMRLLVGLGSYGAGMHSGQEFTLLSAYRDRRALSNRLITELLQPTGVKL